MNLPVRWTIAAALFLLGAYVAAEEAPGPPTTNKQISEPVMTMTPGIYVTSDRGSEPEAFAFRVSEVRGDRFKGTIELVRLNTSGDIIRETSEMTGVLGKQRVTETLFSIESTGRAPFTVKVQNGPLQSRMRELEGNMDPIGFRLFWKLPRNVAGRTHGTFFLTTEDAYQQIMARYAETSLYKKTWRTEVTSYQTSSADLLRHGVDNYVQSTDRWLSASQGNDLELIVSKVRALYARQKKAISGDASEKADAAILAFQIDAYYSQAQFVEQIQDRQGDDQRDTWFSLEGLFNGSPCMNGESDHRLRQDASPVCNGLQALYPVAEQRWNKVKLVIDKRFKRSQLLISELDCIQRAAHRSVEPDSGVTPSCYELKLISK
ncbi:hypothetical protein [Dyella amyloliquefaciens]|uniref:hypothetical protein n=1 Tax=Dyella amyloliquefaciens TaxID=1770545 RepID=UPI00102EAC84|nr:hypothetical protein [Dyella amyloliquefaciens]